MPAPTILLLLALLPVLPTLELLEGADLALDGEAYLAGTLLLEPDDLLGVEVEELGGAGPLGVLPQAWRGADPGRAELPPADEEEGLLLDGAALLPVLPAKMS